MALNLDTKIKVASNIVSRKVQDEEVILQLDSGVYYGLNEVGTEIWHMMKSGKSLRQIITQVSRDYEIPSKRITDDLFTLVKDLKKRKIVQ